MAEATSQTDLLSFLRSLATHLSLGAELPRDEVRSTLDMVRQTLSDLYARYEPPAPEGAEVVREFMLEALELFYQSVEGILGFLEGGDPELLTQSVLQAEEASDILNSIEYVIQQNQEWMSQFSTG
ncbi:MAG TPA: hypothetical protein VNO81_08550 [Candidatus Nitrosotenuis sp.]|nr:hypothetical protein [Candidatus Nitrosotenuis sp.]